MRKMLVLGASGGMGYSIVNELCERGFLVKALARNGEKLNRLFQHQDHVEIVTGDLFNLDDLQNAAKDVEIIFHAANIPYPDWNSKLAIIMQNVLDAAKTSGAKLAIIDNIYSYGRNPGQKVTELTPKNPHTKKGKIRLQLLNMIKQSGVNYCIGHFPDFYGPNAESAMLQTTLLPVLKNKRSMYVGNQKIAREFIFTPDGAKAMVTLALTDKAYGQEWNIAAYDVITGEEIIQLLREITGFDKKVITVTKGMIQFLGLFNPMMREVVEMFYLNEDPVVLSSEKYEKEIGPLPRTPYKEGLQQTIEFMKEGK